MLLADVGAGHDPQPAYQSRNQVRNDVPVKVRHQEAVEGLRANHKLHGGVIHDQLPVLDVGIFLGHLPGAAQEQAVPELHNIGLMHGGHPFPAQAARVVERVAGDSFGGPAGDDLQAGYHVLDHLVLQAGVKVLGVLPEDHQVDMGVAVARLEPGQHSHGADVGIQVEPLAQRDVDAQEAAGHRRRYRPLEADPGALQGFHDGHGKLVPGLLDDPSVQLDLFPIDGNARGGDGADGGPRDLRTDPVSGNQGGFVRHTRIIAATRYGKMESHA